MINSSYIIALSQPEFVEWQLNRVFSSGADERRSSLWRGWSFGGA